MSINDGYMPGQTNNLNWAPSSMLRSRVQSIQSDLNKKKSISVNYRRLLEQELEAIHGELTKRVNEPEQVDLDRQFLDHLDKITNWSKTKQV